MRKKTTILGGLAALGILSGAGWWYHGVEARTDAPPQTVAVEVGDLETTVTALGKVEPLEAVDVGSQISGQVEAIHVAPGDRVREGDLLVEIDPTVYEAQVAANAATLRGLEARLVEQKAMLDLADRTHTRNEKLLAARAVSREELDRSAAEAEAARARLAVLEADIEKARSSLQADEANLGYTRISAPMDGTVMALEVREGQTISARQATPVILKLADLDTMTVKAQVSEADVGKLRVGMEAWFTTLGAPERRWEGSLRQILPTPKVINDVVLYHALFDVENTDRSLLPQMTAQVFFVLDRVEDAPLVPVSALRPTEEPGRFTVRVMNGESAQTRTVTVALQDRVQAAVTEGLEPGERVVAGGSMGS
ncbi:Macrolide-specific efflux protein MacA [Caenispirillum salinarum AK4]|uniref:Macrolide-specific efflux protein MacA n=1 Tax=Caenispirillum salinarum AK4 TaxID=1238182 RepID=K9GYD8_9PROT|nr:efflux RND transporter periplasmic adaptor subunit [Caenispirillum salinarum]EKV29779.1 Macrolide-specific efflux protein MacA [Caenispirillum salinarum AK4]